MMGVSLIYDSEDLSLGVFEGGGAETVVITFSSLMLPRDGIKENAWNSFKYGFQEPFLLKNNVSAFFLVSKKNNWWETDCLNRVVEIVKDHKVYNRAKKIILHGASMGGYASLLACNSLNADVLFLGSPQFSIDKKIAGFENRWPELRQHICFKHNNAIQNFNQFKGEVHLFVDPLHDGDMAQLNLAHYNRENCFIHEVEGAGHMAFLHLKKLGVLDTITHEVLKGINPRKTLLKAKANSVRKALQFDEVVKALKLNENADVYRELSQIFDAELRVSLLKKALRERPNGPLIKKLLKQAMMQR